MYLFSFLRSSKRLCNLAFETIFVWYHWEGLAQLSATIPWPAKTPAIAIRNQARECFRSRSSQASSAQQPILGLEEDSELSEDMIHNTCAWIKTTSSSGLHGDLDSEKNKNLLRIFHKIHQKMCVYCNKFFAFLESMRCFLIQSCLIQSSYLRLTPVFA